MVVLNSVVDLYSQFFISIKRQNDGAVGAAGAAGAVGAVGAVGAAGRTDEPFSFHNDRNLDCSC